MYERTYHKNVLKQDAQAPSRKEIPWKRIGITLGVIAFVTGIVFLIRVPQFQIRSVLVEGTNVADPVEVEDTILVDMQGMYLWVLPKTSIFLSKTEKIAQRITGQFPRFKSVEVKRDSMHSLKVTVEEYPGVYLWCDEACSFMDETGTVFSDAPYFSGSAYPKLYGGERTPYPFNPIGTPQLAMVQTISDRLKALEINPIEFHFENEHKLSVYFYHNSNRSVIYFDPSRDVGAALEVLYSGLRTDPLQKLYHTHDNLLDYLDLRFSNKVVYKFD